MRVIAFILLSCAALCGQAAPATPAYGQTPAKRRVSVIVSITDHSGGPVQQVDKSRFTVSDNNDSGEVQDVRSVNQLPLQLAIVLTASKTNFAQQQNAAIDLARKIIRPNIDSAFVITAGGEKFPQGKRLDWQTDTAAIESMVRDQDRTIGIPDIFAFDFSSDNSGMDRRMNLQQFAAAGAMNVFEVIWRMFDSDPRPARHAIVMFRDPWAHSSGLSSVYSKMVDDLHAATIGDAERHWASFYIIGVESPKAVATGLTQVYNPILPGSGVANRQYDEDLDKFRDRLLSSGRANVDRLAQETGGGFWTSTKKNYSDAIVSISNLLNSQFAVTYVVPNTAPVAEHALRVKSADSNLRIGVQKTYYSRQAQVTSQAAPSLEGKGRGATATSAQ